jgi:protein SCO1/2
MTAKQSGQVDRLRLIPLLLAGVAATLTLAGLQARGEGNPRAPAGLAQVMAQHDHHAHPSISRDAGYLRSLHDYRIPEVALVNADGEPVDLFSELQLDQPLLLNFIFTSCTAICPVLSATFAQVQKELGHGDEAIRLVSISIDPEQDTPDRLKVYAERYHASPRWHFLTGSRPDILKVQQAFDAYRGDKMSHVPLTFLRASPNARWVRIEGFASAADLVAEYSAVVSK